MKNCFYSPEHNAIADLVDAREMGLLNGMLITRINVPAQHRGQGVGRELLKLILAAADAEGLNLYLEISSSDGLTYDELEAWYVRYGFRDIGGVWKRKPSRTRKIILANH